MSAPASQGPSDHDIPTVPETDTARLSSHAGLNDLILKPEAKIREALRRTSKSTLFSQASTVAAVHNGHSNEESLDYGGENPDSSYSASQGKNFEGEDPYSEILPLERPPPITDRKGHHSPHRFLRNNMDKRTKPSPLRRELRLSQLNPPRPSFTSADGRHLVSASQPALLEPFFVDPAPVTNSAADISEALANPRRPAPFIDTPDGESHHAASGNDSESEEEPQTEEIPGHVKGCAPCFYAGAPRVNCQACKYLRELEEIARQQRAAEKEANTPSQRVKSFFFKKSGSCRDEEGKVRKSRKLRKLFKPVVDTWQSLKKG